MCFKPHSQIAFFDLIHSQYHFVKRFRHTLRENQEYEKRKYKPADGKQKSGNIHHRQIAVNIGKGEHNDHLPVAF
ncbi:hypothetical protein SDC9_202080 [bioreactor metagenome]|uniref:Uncharacterized protein n=1 Tax=bioreactor metagenome TaxID=1076179 RepID=A0A645IU40_9ZZZZ